MGVLFCPVFLFMSFLGPHVAPQQRVGILAISTGLALAMPVFYAAMGFVGGVVSAFVYNLIAKWIGGMVVDIQ